MFVLISGDPNHVAATFREPIVYRCTLCGYETRF